MDALKYAMKEIESYVNEDKRTVVTTIRVEDYMGDIDAKFTGKAKCSPEDKFDEKMGKKISKQRAWIKYNKFAKYLLKRDIDRYTALANKAKQMYEEYDEYEKQATNKLNKLIEEVK